MNWCSVCNNTLSNCTCNSCSRCHRHNSNCSCACKDQVKGKCVFYQGANLDCLDVSKGDNYDSILVKLNTLICDILPPSGLTTVVDSCDGNIEVSSVLVDGVNTYTVCLNSDITDQITENTNDILTINACLANTVEDLVSDSITITEESSDACGRTLRLEVLPPSGIPVYDGIIYNNIDNSGTNGFGGKQALKTFTYDYVANSNISDGDEIRFRAIGQTAAVGGVVDTVQIEIYYGGGILADSFTFSPFASSGNSSWVVDGVLTVEISNNSFLYTIRGETSNVANATFSSVKPVGKIGSYDGTFFDTLSIRVYYTNTTMQFGTNNFCRQLMVEVRKKI